jgi:sialic acid synthase SpsE/quercetin dioxygenase-like cupin family protein
MELFNDLVIFEMANSHQGQVSHGLNIINEIDRIVSSFNLKAAVKFQFRDLDTFIHKDFKGRNDVKHINRFESTRLNKLDFKIMIDEVKKLNMIAISTPFDEAGVTWCLDLGIDIIKVASCSANDWPLLEKIAKANKPVIISTGGKTIKEIDKIYNFFIHRNVDFAILHCVSEYPVKHDDVQLDFIDLLRKRYPNIPIGYSGHESPDDTIIAQMAIAKGAKILERHVGVETNTIKLNNYSMNPSQAMNWVNSIVDARKMCKINGVSDKFISEDEKKSLVSLMRGVYSRKAITKDTPIHFEDVYFAMPLLDGNMSSSDFYDGVVATKDYKMDQPISETREKSSINLVRDVIHQAKGLLNESGIKIGNEFTVELSHHYGMKKFREIGATIINIINREYCKKLIIVLPGQKHPEHFHKIKEEAFQLLYGDLTCNIDSVTYNMIPGDIKYVLRNQMHSFSSNGGAIFEEISTTHIKGDSYYPDDKISKLDLIERKTVIEEW